MDWMQLLGPIVGIVATGVGAWIARHLKKPTDVDRATLLATIAADAAAFVVHMYPGKTWADALQLVVQQISTAAGLPTKNAQAIQRAAASALAQYMEASGGAK